MSRCQGEIFKVGRGGGRKRSQTEMETKKKKREQTTFDLNQKKMANKEKSPKLSRGRVGCAAFDGGGCAETT